MKKIIAPIDEKNVCTDWIEDVFDDLSCVKNGRQAMGFINDAPVYTYWEKNCITWRCVEGNGDYESIVKIMERTFMSLIIRRIIVLQMYLVLLNLFGES